MSELTRLIGLVEQTQRDGLTYSEIYTFPITDLKLAAQQHAEALRAMANHIEVVGKAWDGQYTVGFGRDEHESATNLRAAADFLNPKEEA